MPVRLMNTFDLIFTILLTLLDMNLVMKIGRERNTNKTLIVNTTKVNVPIHELPANTTPVLLFSS